MGRFTEHTNVATGVEETFAYVTDQSKLADCDGEPGEPARRAGMEHLQQHPTPAACCA
jgi:hypothetical protein